MFFTISSHDAILAAAQVSWTQVAMSAVSDVQKHPQTVASETPLSVQIIVKYLKLLETV